jgi:hypothetical protein
LDKSTKKLLCPKAGTATSSPALKTASQSNMTIVNIMIWMKRNAYEESTIRKVAKLLKHPKKSAAARFVFTEIKYVVQIHNS